MGGSLELFTMLSADQVDKRGGSQQEFPNGELVAGKEKEQEDLS